VSDQQPFLHYERKQGGADLWAVKITPDNVHQVSKRIGGHVLEGPKGLVLPQNDKYIPVVVELWDYLVRHSDDLYSTFLGLTFEADYKLVEEKIAGELTPEQFWENEFKGEWWMKPASAMSQAEMLANRLDDFGLSREEAKDWVSQVQGEAVLRERARIRKLIDTSE